MEVDLENTLWSKRLRLFVCLFPNFSPLTRAEIASNQVGGGEMERQLQKQTK